MASGEVGGWPVEGREFHCGATGGANGGAGAEVGRLIEEDRSAAALREMP